MNNLTKIAALPGSGGGCMSALSAEKNLAPKVETVTVWPTLEEYKTTVQMKAPYFDEMVFPPIDLGEIGGTGS